MSLTRNDPRHGTTNGYNNLGCRCARCREAIRLYMAENGYGSYRRDACPSCGGAKYPASRVCQDCFVAEVRVDHGTEGAYNRGCSCDDCRQAASAARRRRREAARVPCSHGCGTLVDPYNPRYPGKPPECQPCALERIHDARRERVA